MPEYDTILVERREAVTLVTLNRPQALNALNGQVLVELLDWATGGPKPAALAGMAPRLEAAE